jgi:hypothetical protein
MADTDIINDDDHIWSDGGEEASLEMLDDAIMDAPDDEISAMSNEQIATKAQEVESDVEVVEGKPDTTQEITDSVDLDEGKTEKEESALADNPSSESDKETAEASSEDAAESKEPQKVEDTKTDYKTEYEKLLAPFKANGKQIQVSNVDDALTLMKMGANYNKKMAALKPNLKIVKMLEENDLLDEKKIGHLIDVSKHDTGAINKVLTDAKLDPLDIDTENIKYQPKDHTISDSQMELSRVLTEIQNNESFPKTIDTINNQWDAESKQMALNDPNIISVVDEHIQSGVFDIIVSEMEKERMLGRLSGVSDAIAYKTIGDTLNKQGRFNQQATVPEVQKQVEDPAAAEERKNNRKAAASTKSAQASSIPADFDPLLMPDDEFNKMSANGLYR